MSQSFTCNLCYYLYFRNETLQIHMQSWLSTMFYCGKAIVAGRVELPWSSQRKLLQGFPSTAMRAQLSMSRWTGQDIYLGNAQTARVARGRSNLTI